MHFDWRSSTPLWACHMCISTANVMEPWAGDWKPWLMVEVVWDVLPKEGLRRESISLSAPTCKDSYERM